MLSIHMPLESQTCSVISPSHSFAFVCALPHPQGLGAFPWLPHPLYGDSLPEWRAWALKTYWTQRTMTAIEHKSGVCLA